MGDGKNHHFVSPDHVGDVVFAETGFEIRAPRHTSTEIVEQGIGDDCIKVVKESRLEIEGEFSILIDPGMVSDDVVELFAGAGWM